MNLNLTQAMALILNLALAQLLHHTLHHWHITMRTKRKHKMILSRKVMLLLLLLLVNCDCYC